MIFAFCWCSLFAGLTYGWYRVTPRGTVPFPSSPLPRVSYDDQGLALQSPTGVLAAEVAQFDDQFTAYLYFDYLRSRSITSGMQVLLNQAYSDEGPYYRVRMVVANELVSAVPYLADLQSKGYISYFDLDYIAPQLLDQEKRQTAMYISAYSRPEEVTLEAAAPERLVDPLARFLVFKSNTDPRVRDSRKSPAPERLTPPEAQEIASDMIAVSRFYSIPLDMMLGVGAMENSYMEWAGDLRHVVWKPKPDPGDIVLRRERNRVQVRNYALGLWQITRETLRYSHKLYLDDTRDYSQLPPHLRPSETLDPDTVPSPLFTTYAGLILRDLIDQTGGDLQKAVGAYNGGLKRPNLKYADGVKTAGDYARHVLQCQLMLDARPPGARRVFTADDRRMQAPVAVSIPLAVTPTN